MKGIDIIAVGDNILFIEVKDFRKNSSPSVEHIVSEVAKKFRDSLVGVLVASIYAQSGEKTFFDNIRKSDATYNFVFHFESPEVPYRTGFYSSKLISLTSVYESLSAHLGVLSQHLKVVDVEEIRNNSSSYDFGVAYVS